MRSSRKEWNYVDEVYHHHHPTNHPGAITIREGNTVQIKTQQPSSEKAPAAIPATHARSENPPDRSWASPPTKARERHDPLALDLRSSKADLVVKEGDTAAAAT
jgi:hypothetical protein